MNAVTGLTDGFGISNDSNVHQTLGITEGYSCEGYDCSSLGSYYLYAFVTYQNPNTGNWDGSGASNFYSGPFVVGTVTPLPASLPLFATGLGGLGLLGWRRKRKAAAATASAITSS